ncbi:related to E.coli molybdopterin-converting factor chlN [Cephalotrichum gorgonifer]|uniref:Related to E.coli molybdopterin-converting factor chlN n=1 Tax=Cephalotrichum gorgonifer TaxID=2041049 RepID=A0AAE8STB1_9PEZI|nr:related to E.coli molybdopterin-converting factor chlN [Cephalotrichum gorgonifer]
MSPVLWDLISSPRFQLAATVVASGVTVAGLILGYQAFEQEERLSELKNSIPSLEDHHLKINGLGASSRHIDKEDLRNEALARRAQAGDFDDELILEQLARNRVFLTDEGLAKLRDAFVIVVGVGGVGSHCTAALARSGVSRIRLVDFDQVTLSSLNRHAVATLADVGMPKVQCMYRRMIAITPWVKFDLKKDKFDIDVAEEMLSPWAEDGRQPDFVVDAIDNIDTKVELLKFCHDRGLPVISSAGSGCKSDPTRIMVGDISATTEDPLSRVTRRKLKRLGVHTGIPVVYSVERSGEGKAELIPLSEEEYQKGCVGELSALPNFRARILPVLGTMPAVFGYTLANHIILTISGYPIYYPTVKTRGKLYDSALSYLQGAEERLVKDIESGDPHANVGLKLPISSSDVTYLIEEVYKGKSIITGVPTKLVLIRWRRPEGTTMRRIGSGAVEQKSAELRLRDLVCMTKEEAIQHAEKVLMKKQPLEEVYDKEVIANVEARLAEAEAAEKYLSAA